MTFWQMFVRVSKEIFLPPRQTEEERKREEERAEAREELENENHKRFLKEAPARLLRIRRLGRAISYVVVTGTLFVFPVYVFWYLYRFGMLPSIATSSAVVIAFAAASFSIVLYIAIDVFTFRAWVLSLKS